MREVFEVAELVRVAIEDERTGAAFYLLAARELHHPQIQAIFQDIAEQEKHHQKRFEEMLRQLGDCKTPEQYPGEYTAYLRALTDSRAFPDERTAMQLARKCMSEEAGSAERVVYQATLMERDTLILLNEMRGMIPDKDRPIVEEIIREEQNHLVTLADALRKLKT